MGMKVTRDLEKQFPRRHNFRPMALKFSATKDSYTGYSTLQVQYFPSRDTEQGEPILELTVYLRESWLCDYPTNESIRRIIWLSDGEFAYLQRLVKRIMRWVRKRPAVQKYFRKTQLRFKLDRKERNNFFRRLSRQRKKIRLYTAR